MKVMEIVKLMDPRSVIGIMGAGLHRVEYTGWAMGALNREDLMKCNVREIDQEIIGGQSRICIYIGS